MAFEKYANAAATQLDGAINNSVTTITVDSTSLFPSTGNFRILIEDEIMLAVVASGTTLTVTRAQEGTAAASHADNLDVTHILTAASLLQFLYDRGGYRNLGDWKPSSPGTYDDEFEGAADTVPSGWSLSPTPSGSDELKVNTRWPSIFQVSGTGGTSYTLTRGSFTPGAGDFGIWAKCFVVPNKSAGPDFRFYLYNSGETEGKAIELYAPADNDLRVRGLEKVGGAENTAFGIVGSGVSLSNDNTCVYIGLTRTSGNVWRGFYSNNGIAWQQYGSASSAHSFTVDKIKITFATITSPTFVAMDWVRYRADTEFPRPGP